MLNSRLPAPITFDILLSLSTSCGMLSMILGNTSVSNRDKLSANTLTRFATFSNACEPAFSNSPSLPLRFGASLPSSSTKFFQALVAAPIEPVIVPAASFCVVPAIFMDTCISCTACTMSAKLDIVRFAISPFASRNWFASAIRRSISSFVPPYIMFATGR